MNYDLFSDFPAGGCLHSNPISPGREVPSSATDKPFSDLAQSIDRALRSGSRARNFSGKIKDLVFKVATRGSDIDEDTKRSVCELASSCRASRAVSNVLGYEKLRKKNSLSSQKKDRFASRLSGLRLGVFQTMNLGARSKNFAKLIRNVCRKLPLDRCDLKTSDIEDLIKLSEKCRCKERVLIFLDLAPIRVQKPPKQKREKLTKEQRRENRRARNKVWSKHRRQIDQTFRISCSLRARLRKALRGNRKSNRTLVLLGCSLSEFCKHLEAQWQPGMSWENYSSSGWHIDHIRPCASFDLSDPAEQKACFRYTNLQPLWAKDNIKKGSLYEGKRYQRRKPQTKGET